MSVNKLQYLLIDTNAVDYYIQQRFSPARLCPETGHRFVLMGQVLVKDNHELVIMTCDTVSSLKTINKTLLVYTDHKVFYA